MADCNTPESYPPVFFHRRSLPDDEDNPFSVHEICRAAEKECGFGTILGAQKLGALWRLYPKTNEARGKLLIDGMTLRSHLIQCLDKNPFIVSNQGEDTDIKTTKVIIGNVPISYSNKEIEEIIIKLGCKPHSKLYMERDRDERGGLTRWLTGRRFIYIAVPEKPLPTRVDIGVFKASLYHFEQKALRRQELSTCGRCLKKGHVAQSCPNDIVCRVCKEPEHKQGDPILCNPPLVNVTDTIEQENNIQDQPPSSGNLHPKESFPLLATISDTATTEQNIAMTADLEKKTPIPSSNRQRGRTVTQTTLTFQRSRSYPTSKRTRESPGSDTNTGKHSRVTSPCDSETSPQPTVTKDTTRATGSKKKKNVSARSKVTEHS